MSKDKDLEWIEKSGGYEWTPGSPWPPEVPDEEACNGDDYQHSKMSGESAKYSPQHSDYYYDYNRNDPDRENPFTEAFDYLMGESVTEKTPWIYESPDGGKTVYRYERGTDPLKRELVEIPMADVDDQRAHHFSTNTSKKYQEDIGLKDLGEYVDTTYGGHYTSNDNNVQTLDIIESVGDAKSFCRSNAIKYLTRYDKKGQAKRDILKAAHYCLLLYYFDGHTNTN
tara:strand:- start:598 stop:1275 length:678 start_codon:yes stop_codon:yes gene_type:complete